MGPPRRDAVQVIGVDCVEHLRASHCKPWCGSSDVEYLDGESGLLLTPSIDHLFDRGFISFESDRRLLVSPVAHGPSLQRIGVMVGGHVSVGALSSAQRQYLECHWERVFLEAKVAQVATERSSLQE